MDTFKELLESLDLSNTEDKKLIRKMAEQLQKISFERNAIVSNASIFDSNSLLRTDRLPPEIPKRGRPFVVTEELEAVREKYSNLLLDNPELRKDAENYQKEIKPTTQKQLQRHEKYVVMIEKNRAAAKQMLYNFVTKRSKHLSEFEREILAELRIASEIGIDIPFIFSGKKDEFIEALSKQRRLDKSIAAEQQLQEQIDSLSLKEKAAFIKSAKQILNQFLSNQKENCNGN